MRLSRERLRARILRSIRVDPVTGCWLWRRRRNNQGYPTMTIRVEDRGHPVPMFAHRVSLQVFTNAPRRGQEAAHAVFCPNKHCVNPDHLRWATRLQNEADKRHPSRLRLREIHPPLHFLEMA